MNLFAGRKMLPGCRRSKRLQGKPSGKQYLVVRESEDDVTVNSEDGNNDLFTIFIHLQVLVAFQSQFSHGLFKSELFYIFT